MAIEFSITVLKLMVGPFFRSLRTREKAIHRQLYLAMLIQVVIRLILYTDQYVSRKEDLAETSTTNAKGIDNTVINSQKNLLPRKKKSIE